ncbi:SUKH-4 family immunity protein [Streptomyces sp. NBC_01808]|uniref:SUKH-4 family immunity protein n=1 Tax=Streptomyces sp. NBC_01808 TaxID=2975947 RepID=UPI002DDA8ED1|nr:SUKH-4 family immunity protein [Streptomyces sp. NBC_01808]WSA37839.1 SUKH-4 family immunity protein [Streptomyces sp. NBC_01808]
MIKHQQMTDLYGPENILTLTDQDIEHLGLHAEDAAAITSIGLPRTSSPYFTTEVHGEPGFLNVTDVTTGKGKEHREIVIGGPPGDSGIRFSLSAYDRFITLIQFGGTKPRGEVVNNNLPEFIEFLYRIELHRENVAADPGIEQESLDALRSTLAGIDPFSFELPEDWWAIALHQLGGGGLDL